jgi:hypothetical protein
MDDLLIPQFLCDMPRKVRVNCRVFARRLIKTNSWDVALEGEPLVLLKDAPGSIVIQRGPDWELEFENVFAYALLDAVSEECSKKGRDWAARYISLVERGLYMFWVSLAALDGPKLGEGWSKVVDLRAFHSISLRRILNWWPQLCDLDRRFHRGLGKSDEWTAWGGGIVAYARAAGMPDSEWRQAWELDSESAGASIARWLDQNWPRSGPGRLEAPSDQN